jgi:hypothetical protein
VLEGINKTMTDIVKIESFNGVPVRVVTINDQPMIPLNDVADSITHDRSGLRKLFHRNEEIVGKWSGVAKLATAQGIQETICLNHDGVMAILMKVDFMRVKDPVRKQRIIDFQEWAATTLSKIMQGETIPIPRDDAIEAMVRSHLNIADAMVEFAHVDRGIMTTVALARVESETGADLSWLKGLVRKDRAQPPGLLNAGQVGAELGGLTATTINKMLAQLGYQYWAVTQWQPTGIGRGYGENIPFTVTHGPSSSHSGYQWKWSYAIVEVLRNQINGTAQIRAAY